MGWLTETLTSSIGRKVLMALTGLFLILFLTIHLMGNLQLLANDGGESFNTYSYFMSHNGLIQLVSKGNFFFIALHAVVGIMLARKNKKARPIGYKVSGGSTNSTWASRSMALLGVITFLFLIVHLKGFWYEMHYGAGLPQTTIDGVTMNDSYAIVLAAYGNVFYTAFYTICMIIIGFHLYHGFSSAFQTLGINHKKYTPFIKRLGQLYAIAVTILFAVIPIMLYLKTVA